MAITGQVQRPPAFGEVLIADWQAAELIKASMLKPVFTTIEQSLVIRKMGMLSDADAKTLREIMVDVLG